VPNWNMSVAMVASGDLPRTLREAAGDARTLHLALKDGTKEVKAFGKESRATARDVRRLGSDSRSAARDVDALANAARAAQRQLHLVSSASGSSRAELAGLRGESAQTGRDLARMSARINATIRDLDRLAASSRRAGARTATAGAAGERSMRRLDTAVAGVRSRLGGVLTLLAGGALIEGGAEMVKNGNEFTQAMNLFGSTSNATSMQMARASDMANRLGADLTLPKASAIDAADAMVELAKAGFRTDQAIDGTRASLLLSVAAQVNAADSAKYLGDMMDQFGLSADQAGKAADILAATANSASGGVTDIYYAMKYAGPIAHGLGVDMADAATGVGMLAKAGILGQTAGTSLRGILVNMSKPTKAMAEGLKTLGIEAYDSQGNFKGLRYVIENLQTAQKKLNQKDFLAAAAKAFGKPAVSGAVALAHQGVQSYDALSVAVRQQGAAAAIAAAQGKGLSGAMAQLKTQSKQTGLAIYQGMSPGLEYITRGLTAGMAFATPKITAWFKHLNSAAVLFGPDLEAKIHRTFGSIGNELRDVGGSFKGAGLDLAADALHLILNVGEAAVTVLKHLADGAEPVVHALGDVADGGNGVSSTLDTVVFAVDETAKAVGALSGILVPLGHLVGTLVQDFGHLPGPVQSAILAMLLARRVTPIMTGLAGSVRGRVTPALRGFRDEMTVQRSLAASAGVSLSRYGAAFAALETRVPVIGRMAASFRTASTAGGAFAGTLRGVTAAAGTGLRSAASGLVGFLGGPWGAAIAAGTIVLGLWASAQQRAAQATAEHKAGVDGLTQAMRESNGATTQAVREQAANLLQTTKVKGANEDLITILGKAGYSLQSVTDAYLGQGTSLKGVATHLDDMAASQEKAANSAKRGSDAQGKALEAWNSYSSAAKTVRGLAGEADKAQKKAKALNDAVTGNKGSSTAYDKLKASVSALADSTADADARTRALKQALDLLSGGTLDFQAAEAQMNTAITNANEQLADGVKRADGWKTSLLNANGSISTVTKNGQQLYGSMTDIADSTTAAAQAAFALAQSQGKDITPSIAEARKEMQRGRDAAIALAKQYGMNSDEAKKVADSLGLIPGQVSILLQTQGVDGVLAELLAVQAQLQQTPNAKTITVDALSAEAQTKLKTLGFTIQMIPGTRQFKLTVPTAGPKAALSDIQSAINDVVGKTVPINIVTTHSDLGVVAHEGGRYNKDGGVFTYYADGGTHERHVAQIAPGGDYRVWAEPETGGESYIPLDPAKRPRSRAIAMETVRRLGGDPAAIAWHADGGVGGGPRYFADGGYSYSPSGVVRGAGDVQSAYDDAHQPITKEDYDKKIRARANAVDTLRSAEARLAQVRSHRHTHAALVAAENAVAKARRSVAAATAAARAAEARYKKTFSLSDWSKTLSSTVKANAAYEANLARIAARGGSDVIAQLRDMGAEGASMVAALAKSTNAQFNSIVANLRKLGPLAKATLGDYTAQLNASNKVSSQFAANLAKLSAEGYGDLAAQLAGQGDDVAQKLAADAVKSKGAAAKANAAAKTAGKQLTSDQVSELVQIIAAVKSSTTGIHSVADTTGLGEDEIVAVAGKAAATIKSALGSRSGKFLLDLARAQKGLSYANGGIRPGIYGTHAGAVTFAEPSTGGEAFLPLGANKRAAATRVLGDVAHRFGLGMVPAGGDRRVVVVHQGGDTINVSAVRTGASASDIGAQVGRAVRRAKRGGVNARAY
jgi:TP901 family phage tail tape measure protein